MKSAPTLEELAARIGIPAGALVETVARYNRMVAGGEDKDFGRFGPGGSAARPAKIEAPPFYAVQFFPITRKSMGGIQVDRSCRVLDRQGQPIPGLYAVGELAGFAGINGKAALEGTFLGPSLVMGRVAARAIVAASIRHPPSAIGNRQSAIRNPQSAGRPCASCHDLPALLAKPRSGYWHFEQSHRVVLEKKQECAACHAELSPYDPGAHRTDPVAQIQTCPFCHGG